MEFSIHFVLAIALFIMQSWIGNKSYSRGYIKFSLLDEQDEAHSLNFVIKVFGPIVFLIITVASLQYLNLNEFNQNIINVIYYYIILRLLAILLYERWRIVNWVRIVSYYLIILLVSNIIYDKFINSVGDLLPDFSQLKNEIWLLIIVFVYQIGNGVAESTPINSLDEKSRAFLPEIKPRKRKYIIRMFLYFHSKYDKQIQKSQIYNPSISIVIYSILIYENFNRPRFIRFLERCWVRISHKNVTQGIMQVGANKPISDEKSIELALSTFEEYLSNFNMEDFDNEHLRSLIKKHCPDRKYIRQVLFIAKAIMENQKDQKQYEALNREIIQEFELYSY